MPIRTQFCAAIIAVLFLLFSPISLRAEKPGFEVKCEPLEILAGRIEYCTQNRFAYESGLSCYNQLMEKWKVAEMELIPLLSVSSGDKTGRQSKELGDAKKDYAAALKKLDELINLTDFRTDQIASYPRAMILIKHGQSQPCYASHRDRLTLVVRDLDKKIKEARAVVKLAKELNASSEHRELLVSDSGLARGGVVRAVPAAGSGRQANGASDVTGLKEDQMKRGELTGVSGGKKIRPAISARTDFSRSNISEKRDEVVHNSDFRMQGLGNKIDPSGTFSQRGKLDVLPPPIDRSGNDSGWPESSVGAVLWKENSDTLEIGIAANQTESADNTEPSILGSSDSLLVKEVQSPMTEPEFKTISESRIVSSVQKEASVAGAEADLFQVVSSRYRATELFQKARSSSAPLTAFESKIKQR